MPTTTADQLELVVAADNLQRALEEFTDELIAWPHVEIAFRHQPALAVTFAKLMVLINHQKGAHANPPPPAAAPAVADGDPCEHDSSP